MLEKSETKILVVDDEPDLRLMVAAMLGEEGFAVETAADGVEALRMEAKTRPHLILMDLSMPNLDGMETLKALRQKGSPSAVIIMSGNQDMRKAVQCIQLGAADYLSKPFSPEDLAHRVQATLRTLHLQSEVVRLREEVESSRGLDRLVGESPAIKELVGLVRKVASLDITVLLQGESGTGKEVVAESIHLLSLRRDKPLVSVDCTAIPETLVESELFGYEKGAFTGASERKQGRFESANGGTLFLDEIGNLPLAVQMKLLRVLQERQVTRLGSKASQPIDVRIIAASNADLRKAIEKGEFREDLYHRLNEFLIPLPPLRERQGDVKLLAHYFLRRFNSQFNCQVSGFSREALEALASHPWKGNVRELINVVRRAVIMVEGIIDLKDLPQEFGHPNALPVPAKPENKPPDQDVLPEIALPAGEGPKSSLKEAVAKAQREVECRMINEALQASHFNKVKAARDLGIDYKTLWKKINDYHLE